ncbi:MAG: AsmA family protein [Xanthomonadales bacterium]|nr:AsmA family protein [Xanthomonadales bacterium]
MTSSRTRRLTWIIPLALLGLLLIAVVVVVNLDLGRFEETVERRVSEAIGREFRIDGGLSGSIGTRVHVVANDISVSNTDWSEPEHLARIERVEARVDTWSLLGGPIEVESLSIDGARVHLEEDEQGRVNWILGDPEAPAEEPREIVLGTFELTDASLTLVTPEQEQPLEVTVTRLAQVLADDGAARIEGEGTINDRTANISGRLDPFEHLLYGGELHFSGQGELGPVAFDVSGRLDDAREPARPELELTARADDVREVQAMLGLPRGDAGEVNVAARIQPGDDQLLVDIEGQVGAFNMNAEGWLSDLRQAERLALSLNASGQNVRRVTRFLGLHGWPDVPFQLDAELRRDGDLFEILQMDGEIGSGRFSLAGTLPAFPSLDGARMQGTARGQDIAQFRELVGLPGLAEGPFELDAAITQQEGGTEAIDARLETGLGELNVAGTIEHGEAFAGTRLRASATGPSARRLGDAAGFEGLPAASFKVNGEFELEPGGIRFVEPTRLEFGGHRVTLRQYMAYPVVGPGSELQVTAAGPDFSGFAPVLGMDFPELDDPYEIEALLGGTEANYVINSLQGTIGGQRLSLSGEVARGESLAGTELEVRASGDNLAQIAPENDWFMAPAQPFEVNARLAWSDTRMTIGEARLATGDTVADVTADLPWPLDTSRGRFDARLVTPDASRLLVEKGGFQPAAVPLNLEARGAWQDGIVTVETGRLRMGGADLQLNGTLDLPPDSTDTDLALTLGVPDLSSLGTMEGEPLPALPFQLTAQAGGTSESLLLRELDARLGDSRVTGQLEIAQVEPRPRIDAVLSFTPLDLKPFTDPPNEDEDEAPRVPGKQMIPDTALPVDLLTAVDGSLRLDIDRLQFHTTELTEVALDAKLNEGLLEFSPFRARPARGEVELRLRAEPVGEDALDVRAEFAGKAITLNLTREQNMDIDQTPKYDLDGWLEGRGATVRDLATTLDGKFRVTSDGGRVRNTRLSNLFGDFMLGLLKSVFPDTQEQRFTEVECVAAVLDANDGVISTAPGIAIRTSLVNMSATGRVFLASERIEADFKTSARGGTGLSIGSLINPLVTVRGTLANPKLALDPAGTLLTGGAAVASGGLSLLAQALYNRVSRSSDPCGEVLQAAELSE